jgi:hypothetical protein
MKKTVLLIQALAFFMAFTSLLTAPALADTVYTYTGNPFTHVVAPITTSDFVSASFTVASPLAPDSEFSNELLGALPINPISWDVSTAGYTLSNTTPGVIVGLNFWTDSQGNIVDWIFGAEAESVPGQIETDRDGLSDFVGDNFGTVNPSFNSDNPGVWTISTSTPSAVPEPQSLLLVTTGLLGVLSTVRRNLRRS